jgi:hypothetical protein
VERPARRSSRSNFTMYTSFSIAIVVLQKTRPNR